MEEYVISALNDHRIAIDLLEAEMTKIIELSKIFIGVIKKGGKIIVAGNGGSASDSQHLAAEFMGEFKKQDRRPFPCVSINTDTSVMTAISNDFGYENIFSRQLEGIAKPNDIFVAISTSGNSLNLINALGFANKNNIKTVCLLGKDGGKMKKLCSFYILIGTEETERVQEAHITLIHIISKLCEDALSEEPK